jgi:hypothetical protein
MLLKDLKGKTISSVSMENMEDVENPLTSRTDLTAQVVVRFTDGTPPLIIQATVEETPYMIIPCLKVPYQRLLNAES